MNTCTCNLDIRIHKNWTPSKKSAEAHLAMIQLEQLRNCWRQGWTPSKGDSGFEPWLDLIADEKYYSQYKDVCFPAWSLDRLRELIPENIFTGVRNQWHRVMYNGVLTYEEGDDSLVSFRGANIYDRCISCIEWLIKEVHLNKEYLV